MPEKFFKRLAWRLYNLTPVDFINSYFSVQTIKINNLDIPRYDEYLKNLSKELIDKNPCFFILIKPSGIEYEDKIKAVLKRNKIQVYDEKTIDDYVRLGLRIYHRPYHTKEREFQSYLWFALDEYLYADKLDKSKCLFLTKESVEHKNLQELKREIRLNIGHIKFYRVIYNNLQYEVFSSFVHIPDQIDLEREYSIVKNY